MQLVIIRHAIAEDPKVFAQTGRPDAQRPLTDDGVDKMKRGVKGLREVLPEITLIATSPFVRAVETAKIVAAAYKDVRTVIIHELVPDETGDAFVAWLRGLKSVPVVAVVGHEPHLSALASWLLSGQTRSAIELKKGGVISMEFEGEPAGGSGVLLWALAPRQLRALAEK
jgi:phosphohistidine phosphatase